MAWVEAAVVYYLRTMFDRIEPYQPNPLPIMGGLGTAELVREAATLVMLLAVGILAGSGWRERLGYSAIAFGVWDIFYYVFLKALCGWPHSLLDWDILFLLPLPWWGPVLAPVLIALLMIVWGTLTTTDKTEKTRQPSERLAWTASGLGAMFALSIFMRDAYHVAGQGTDALRNVLPTAFPWTWFSVALILMSAPACTASRQLLFQIRMPKSPDIVLATVGTMTDECIPLLLKNSQGRGTRGDIRKPEQGSAADADASKRAPGQLSDGRVL
jgi:hypothetical protein